MGVAVYLISIICERFLNINQRIIDMLIGVIVLFPAGFIFSEAPQQLPPALQSVFFVPHVAAYLFAYILMFKAAVAAIRTFCDDRTRIRRVWNMWFCIAGNRNHIPFFTHFYPRIAVHAIPDRNPVTPPDLSAYAPVRS